MKYGYLRDDQLADYRYCLNSIVDDEMKWRSEIDNVVHTKPVINVDEHIERKLREWQTMYTWKDDHYE